MEVVGVFVQVFAENEIILTAEVLEEFGAGGEDVQRNMLQASGLRVEVHSGSMVSTRSG